MTAPDDGPAYKRPADVVTNVLPAYVADLRADRDRLAAQVAMRDREFGNRRWMEGHLQGLADAALRLLAAAADRDRLAAQVAAVEALHHPYQPAHRQGSFCADCGATFPCPTRRALTEVGMSIVEDGFGSGAFKCDRPDCDLQVVGPGSFQCSCQEARADRIEAGE